MHPFHVKDVSISTYIHLILHLYVQIHKGSGIVFCFGSCPYINRPKLILTDVRNNFLFKCAFYGVNLV